VSQQCNCNKYVVDVCVHETNEHSQSVHYIARYASDGEEYDNTYKRNKPEEFLVGSNQVIPGIDIAIRSMTKQETSKFILSNKYTHKVNNRKSHFQFRTNESLEYEIQLIDWRNNEPIENEWIMGLDEKLRIGRNLKEDGNIYFKEEKYNKSYRLYKRAVKTLKRTKSNNSTTDTSHNEQIAELNSLKITCLLNMAACCLKLNRYNDTITYCTEILTDYTSDFTKDQRLKALYRRGQANLANSEFEAARSDLEQAKQLAPDNKPVLAELKKLQQTETQYKNQLKKMYQKMFD
jgi:FK506-binding protein 4/5